MNDFIILYNFPPSESPCKEKIYLNISSAFQNPIDDVHVHVQYAIIHFNLSTYVAGSIHELPNDHHIHVEIYCNNVPTFFLSKNFTILQAANISSNISEL